MTYESLVCRYASTSGKLHEETFASKARLILHFDINKTIIMLDKAQVDWTSLSILDHRNCCPYTNSPHAVAPHSRLCIALEAWQATSVTSQHSIPGSH